MTWSLCPRTIRPVASGGVGIITDLKKDPDGYVRTAEIRFANGRVTRRSVSHLSPLETAEERPANRPGIVGIPKNIEKKVGDTRCPMGLAFTHGFQTGGFLSGLKKLLPWFVIVGSDVATDVLLKSPPPSPTLKTELVTTPLPPDSLFDSNVSIGEGLLAIAFCLALVAALKKPVPLRDIHYFPIAVDSMTKCRVHAFTPVSLTTTTLNMCPTPTGTPLTMGTVIRGPGTSSLKAREAECRVCEFFIGSSFLPFHSQSSCAKPVVAGFG
uniref:Uncharacterized protein n=1 Tax=Ditylenchus dipsaci TaxID=166011 RepID=A0A915DD21_9BILA